MASLQSFLAEAKDVNKKKRQKYSINERSKNKEATMSSSMFLMCDFGAVKQVNKALKKLNELKQITSKPRGRGLGKQAENLVKNPDQFQKIKSRNNANLSNQRERLKLDKKDKYSDLLSERDVRENNILGFNPINRLVGATGSERIDNRAWLNKPTVVRKPKSSEEYYTPKRKYEVKPDTENFTDIRKTRDSAASSTGYLGFRTDPYKGYGGMMEEPVDMIKTGRRTSKARIEYSSPTTTSDFGFVLPKKYNTDKIRSSIALNRDGLKYIRKTEKQMFGLHPEVRDPRKLIRLAGVRSNLATQIKNKERILGKR